VKFDKCIIAAGSQAIKLPFMPDDPRVVDSTGALELAGDSQAHARRRRRHHRPRDGDGVLGARHEDRRRRDAGHHDGGADRDLVKVWEK
jgi:dihydrolipoamide dehydrogenase